MKTYQIAVAVTGCSEKFVLPGEPMRSPWAQDKARRIARAGVELVADDFPKGLVVS